MCLGKLSVWQIAKQQKVTSRHVRRLYSKYLETGNFPFPKKSGVKLKPVSLKVQKLVEKTYKKYPIGAVKMEEMLDFQGLHVPHNTIHKILKANDFAKTEKRKSKRRKWIRWERKHSNSLWHIDYCKFNGKNVLGILDDASRFITGCNEFNNASALNATKVLEKAIYNFGCPKQLLSDNGSHFMSVIRETCPDPENNVFQKTLNKYGIQHIRTRVNHPQTNGKLERWFGTYKKFRTHFRSSKKAVKVYNEDIHHLSLTNSSIRTPAQAFVEKMR